MLKLLAMAKKKLAGAGVWRNTTPITAIKRWLVFFALPIVVPAVWMLYYIKRFGVNVPYSDEWLIVPIFQKLDHGLTLGGLHALWHAQSYHRLFFTESLISAAAYIDHWNIKTEMYISFALCIITMFFLYLIIRRTITSPLLAFLMMLLSAFWLFSPVQTENWLWGWDVAWFLCSTAAIMSIYFLIRATGKYLYFFLGLAIAAGVISTFSFGWGQAVWPVGLLILLLQRQSRRPIVVWSAAALLSYAAYYFHFSHSGGSIPVFEFLHEPLNAICYLFVMFGRPFSYDLYPAMFLGAISFLLVIPVLMLAWNHRQKLELLLPWLAVIAFAILGGLMIILSRLHEVSGHPTPLIDAMQTRYTAMPLLYLVGLSGLSLTVVDSLRLNRRLLSYVVLVLLIVQIPLIWSNHYVGVINSKERYDIVSNLQTCSRQPTDKVSKDCLSANNYLNTYPVAKEQLQYLKDKHWAGY